jgi:hypothetical protein
MLNYSNINKGQFWCELVAGFEQGMTNGMQTYGTL